MSPRLRVRLETVNPLAIAAMLCVLGLAIFGDVSSEAALAAILGIAVPGHSSANPPA